jgi:hypothetical protein
MSKLITERWGLSFSTTADSIIDAMIEEGDLEAA